MLTERGKGPLVGRKACVCVWVPQAVRSCCVTSSNSVDLRPLCVFKHLPERRVLPVINFSFMKFIGSSSLSTCQSVLQTFWSAYYFFFLHKLAH